MAKIIGVCGKAGSGKDTFGQYALSKVKPDNAVHLSFAKPLKDIKLMQKKLNDLREDDVAVITDVRFPNECELIKDVCNGVLVKIKSEVHGKGKMTGVHKGHSSEFDLDDEIMDHIIRNNSNSISLFHKQCDSVLDKIL
jgi:hypothetical protein